MCSRVVDCCSGIVFFTTCQKDPMYGPTFWHVVFLLINFYQIGEILYREGWRTVWQSPIDAAVSPTPATAPR